MCNMYQKKTVGCKATVEDKLYERGTLANITFKALIINIMDPMYLTWNCVLLCNNAQAANSANGRSPQDASSGGGSVYFDFHMQMALYVVLKIFNCNERWDYDEYQGSELTGPLKF